MDFKKKNYTMKIFAALFFAVGLPAAAQKVEVPQKLDFAGITLSIRDDARREIQKDVDALTASPRHYHIKAERAKTYFPIIEKVFREEGVPDDFKFLVLQESALIPDAVSTSNAVGFWQFKDFTAIEMGLRVDREIDERLNIVASTRAAARYLLKNNQFFDNWLYALQAYQMGAGGVMKSVEDTQARATRMEITGKTYWYIKKYLAHKIAYEEGVKGTPQRQVVAFENRGRNTLNNLAREIMVEEAALRDLNKWTKSGVIPEDRTYVVLLPVEGTGISTAGLSAAATPRQSESKSAASSGVRVSVRSKINGIPTIQAVEGDDARRIAARSGVDYPKFIKWNDLKKGDPVKAGQMYFLGRKRLKGSEAFHTVAAGESLWAISQRYGIQEKRLKQYNRIEGDINPAPGAILYLASRRPHTDAIISNVHDAVEVNRQDTFNWSVQIESVGEELASTRPADDYPAKEIEISLQEQSAKPVDSVKILQANKTTATLEDTTSQVTLPLPANMEHTVKAGETLYGIARLYNLGVMDIVSLNELDLQQGIKPGQVLRLPTQQSPSKELAMKEEKTLFAGKFFHEVKTSDTLYSIARQYNVTIKEIMEWNEKKDFSLAIGEKLKILRVQ
jgi:membrane-bound lytic murein transglycosylase D